MGPWRTMKVDAAVGIGLAGTAVAARRAEDAGFDAVWTVERSHDAFLPLVLAAEHTQRVQVGTAVVVVRDGRDPLTVATKAHDLQLWSRGRFVLGLGVPPGADPGRLRDFVLTVRALWANWNEGVALDDRHAVPHHADPGPNPFGPPRIFVAGDSTAATDIAGEVADGLFCHPLGSALQFWTTTAPALERGLARRGRSRRDVEVSVPCLVATGRTDEELDRAVVAARQQVAFHGANPALRPVLDLHGMGDLATALASAARRGAWDEAGDLVTDEVLSTFAAVGSPYEVGRQLAERYGAAASRITLDVPYAADPAAAADTLDAVRDGFEDALRTGSLLTADR